MPYEVSRVFQAQPKHPIMRFKSSIRNVNTFISALRHSKSVAFALISLVLELTASLNSLNKIAWIRLDNNQFRCTVIPEQGSQVWAYAPLYLLTGYVAKHKQGTIDRGSFLRLRTASIATTIKPLTQP